MTRNFFAALQVSPVALACGVGLAVACILPFLLWGNPYSPLVLRYWMTWGTPVVVVAALAGILPLPWLSTLPQHSARIILKPTAAQFAFLIAAFTTGTIVYYQATVFQFSASTSDEIAQLWHAKMLAHGFLALPADPNPEFFAIDNVIDRPKWYSHFPIGGPAALVPGVLIGAPWLVNPVLAGLSALFVHHFARTAFGEVQGRCAGALFALTPNILFMSGTYMNHTPVLFLATVIMAALAEWERAASSRRRFAFAALTGLAIGLIATIRPLDAVIVTAAAGAFQLYVIRGDLRRVGELAVQAVAGFVGVLPLLIANAKTNGSAFRFGYDVMWGEGHRIGFHADPRGDVHDFPRGVMYAARYVSELNFTTMAWPLPIVAIVLVGLVAMRRTNRWDALLFALILAQVGGYSAYWGLGEFLGPRFLFTALPAVVIVMTRAPFLFAERSGARAGRSALVLYLACLAVAWTVPNETASVRGFADQVRGLRRVFRLDIAEAVRAAGVHNALVFVREPPSGRLVRRMWGVGVPRDLAADLIANRDFCSALQAVRAAERDSSGSVEARVRMVESGAMRFTPGLPVVATRDPLLRIASMEALTDECRAELDRNNFVPATFGAALVLEEFDDEGRLAGDVIYAADLSDHNEALRERFKDRTWYRLVVSEGENRTLSARIVPYEVQ